MEWGRSSRCDRAGYICIAGYSGDDTGSRGEGDLLDDALLGSL